MLTHRRRRAAANAGPLFAARAVLLSAILLSMPLYVSAQEGGNSTGTENTTAGNTTGTINGTNVDDSTGSSGPSNGTMGGGDSNASTSNGATPVNGGSSTQSPAVSDSGVATPFSVRATVRFKGMTSAWFNASVRAKFIQAIGMAGGLPVSNVSVTSVLDVEIEETQLPLLNASNTTNATGGGGNNASQSQNASEAVENAGWGNSSMEVNSSEAASSNSTRRQQGKAGSALDVSLLAVSGDEESTVKLAQKITVAALNPAFLALGLPQVSQVVSLQITLADASSTFEIPQVKAEQGTVDYLTPHCGKNIRIMTHYSPPYVIFDINKCIQTMTGVGDEKYALRCPHTAFGDANGDFKGITYDLFTDDVLPILRDICRKNGKDDRVEFDWYVPPVDPLSPGGAVQMVCNGGMQGKDEVDIRTHEDKFCRSTTNYQGPSAVNTCLYAGDPSCASPGADLAVGALYVTLKRLDELDWTPPYVGVRQIIVRPPTPFDPLSGIMHIFQPFTWELWMCIGLEIVLVWLILMVFEMAENPTVDHHSLSTEVFDTFYWTFASAMDPGASGKAPDSWAGKLILTAHWVFLVIIAACYTGTIAAFLAHPVESLIITDVDSLKQGPWTVVVRGPKLSVLDDATEASESDQARRDLRRRGPHGTGFVQTEGDILIPAENKLAIGDFSIDVGNYMGSNSVPDEVTSLQFDVLQRMMHQDARTLFNFVTTESLESRNLETGKAVETHDVDICDNINSTLLLGAFDLVACRGKGKLSGKHPQADALMVDAPIAYYELNQRAKARRSFWWLSQCDLVTVGPEFATNGFGAGFPKVSPMFSPFSRALAFLRSEGVVHRLEKRYETTHDDNLCREDNSSIDESQAMPLRLLTGLLAFTGGLTIAALVHGLVERRLRGGHAGAQAEAQREIEELEWMEAEEKRYLAAEGRKTAAHGKKFAGARVIHIDESKKGSLIAEEIKARENMRLLQRGGEIKHAHRDRMREKRYAEEHGQVYTPENHPKNHYPAHMSRSFEGFIDIAMRGRGSHSGDQDEKGIASAAPNGVNGPVGANKSKEGAAARGEVLVLPPASKTEKKKLEAPPPVDGGGAPVDSKSREKRRRRRRSGGVVDADKVRSIAESASRIEAALRPHIGSYLDEGEGAFMSPRGSVVGREGSVVVDVGGVAPDDDVILALPLEVEGDTLFSPRTPRLVVQAVSSACCAATGATGAEETNVTIEELPIRYYSARGSRRVGQGDTNGISGAVDTARGSWASFWYSRGGREGGGGGGAQRRGLGNSRMSI